MNDIMEYATQAQNLVESTLIFLGSLLAISLVIPGDQPDKFLKKCLDILLNFSKKKK